jgi:hypothetical protein
LLLIASRYYQDGLFFMDWTKHKGAFSRALFFFYSPECPERSRRVRNLKR